MQQYDLNGFVKQFLIRTSQNAYVSGNEEISQHCSGFLDFYRYLTDGKKPNLFEEILAYNNLCIALENKLFEHYAPIFPTSISYKLVHVEKQAILKFLIDCVSDFAATDNSVKASLTVTHEKITVVLTQNQVSKTYEKQ